MNIHVQLLLFLVAGFNAAQVTDTSLFVLER
uniref:Uncharacterized protein n=1 Tax=Anguilla anguilla TaxID=7936 RepID=A0A0E9Q8L3_ANGAN